MGDNRLFWADRIAEQIIYNVDHNPYLKDITKKSGYIVYDEKTPSGQIHIGSGRGWVIHDTIARALRDKGINAQFVLSADDMDPMDALPNLDNKNYWKQFMGKPFRDIPSPVDGYKSYADYYFTEATSKFYEYGIDAKLESTGQRYIDGDFNKTIKTALDNATKISDVFSRFYEDHKLKNELPFNPKCEKCGKIGTTRAFEWNSDTELVKYTCEDDYVTWATGCGHSGEISPYNGNGKFPWKVEWAAKWPTVGVLYETAGKDHFSAGGSRDVAIAISNEVFNHPPPLPSTVKKKPDGSFIYKRGESYEFFLVGGAKMSSSKGQGFPFSEMTKYAPGNILKFILVSNRPKTAINFDPQSKLEQVYREYDETEKLYYDSIEKPDLLKKDKYFNAKRIYELAHIGEIQKERPPTVEFNFGLMIVQLTKSTKDAIELLKQKGKLSEKLNKRQYSIIEKRLNFFRSWLTDFASEDKIISLKKPTSSLTLNDSQKSMIEKFKELVNKSDTEQELLQGINALIKTFDVEKSEFFEIIYQLLFAKPKGPRLIPYIIFSGKETIINHIDSFFNS